MLLIFRTMSIYYNATNAREKAEYGNANFNARKKARANFILNTYGEGIPYDKIEIGKVYKIMSRNGENLHRNSDSLIPPLRHGRVTKKFVAPTKELYIEYQEIETGTLVTTPYSLSIFLPTVDDIHKRLVATTGILPEQLSDNVIRKISSFGGKRTNKSYKSRHRRRRTNKSSKYRSTRARPSPQQRI